MQDPVRSPHHRRHYVQGRKRCPVNWVIEVEISAVSILTPKNHEPILFGNFQAEESSFV